MAELSPRQAAQALGVSESTMRRWCDSGLVRSSKTSGGHRRIRRQELVRFAQGRGMSMLDSSPLTMAGRGGRLAAAEELSARFYEALLGGDDIAAQQLALGLLERTGEGATLCDDVIAPAMHRVGDAWASDHVAVFSEHAATQRVSAAIAMARIQLSPPAGDAPVAICSALEDDPYTLATAMCALVLSAGGYRVTLLGSHTPAGEVLRAAVELSAALVAVSVSVEPSSLEGLHALCAGANAYGVRLALGGRALSPELRKRLQPDFFGDTMAHLASYGTRLMETLR